jgi:hypothetical protein
MQKLHVTGLKEIVQRDKKLDIEITADNENFETGTAVELDRGLRQSKR